MPPVITLMTDFGLSDPFVGIMKGVILKRAPGARLVDITHDIEPQNIEQAARVLDAAWSWFPPKTVHVVVVDPGVGSERRALAVASGRHRFVGPDNGVLTPALGRGARCYELTREKFFQRPVSRTFHGRDVFAPVAGWLASGTPVRDLGKAIRDPETLELAEPVFDGRTLTGKVVYQDRFGNLMTNIKPDHITNHFKKGTPVAIWIGRRRIGALVDHYSVPVRGRPGALINSWNALEIFCREDSAALRLKCRVGDRIQLKPDRSDS